MTSTTTSVATSTASATITAMAKYEILIKSVQLLIITNKQFEWKFTWTLSELVNLHFSPLYSCQVSKTDFNFFFKGGMKPLKPEKQWRKWIKCWFFLLNNNIFHPKIDEKEHGRFEFSTFMWNSQDNWGTVIQICDF